MPSISTSSSLWETVKCDFKGLFPEDVFQMWFEPIQCLEASGDFFMLGVPNDFPAIWIHDNYLDLISQRLRLVSGRMINVTLKKVDGKSGSQAAAPSETNSTSSRFSKPAVRKVRYDERASPYAATLNPR